MRTLNKIAIVFATSLLLIFVSLEATSSAVNSATAKSTEDVLRFADTARGGGQKGLKWTVDVESTLKRGRQEQFQLQVSVASGDWLAEFQAPKNVVGNKLLQKGDNMWFTKKRLRKPVPISQRQRLTGSASNGDIASTNYVEDYQATRLADEMVDGHNHWVFDLKAKTSKVTYDKVKYWVNQDTGLGVRAEFSSSRGKLLKSADFFYDNQIIVDDTKRPFISRMVIQDEINKVQRSVLNYSNIVLKPISAAKFRL